MFVYWLLKCLPDGSCVVYCVVVSLFGASLITLAPGVFCELLLGISDVVVDGPPVKITKLLTTAATVSTLLLEMCQAAVFKHEETEGFKV